MLASVLAVFLGSVIAVEAAEVTPNKKAGAPEALLKAPAARLRVEVIQAKVSEAKAEGLDVDKLAPPDYVAAKLLSALRALGQAKLIIRDSRPVLLSKEPIELKYSNKVPYVGVRHRLSDGRTQTIVEYGETRAFVELRAVDINLLKGTKLTCLLSVKAEYSGLSEHGVKMEGDALSPVFYRMFTEQMVKLESGKPALMSTVQRLTSKNDGPGEFAVLVMRIEVTAD